MTYNKKEPAQKHLQQDTSFHVTGRVQQQTAIAISPNRHYFSYHQCTAVEPATLHVVVVVFMDVVVFAKPFCPERERAGYPDAYPQP